MQVPHPLPSEMHCLSSTLAILLSQFRMSFSEIASALLDFDEEKLTVEQLISLRYMFPLTEEEQKLFEAFEGSPTDLATADRFYYEVPTFTLSSLFSPRLVALPLFIFS